MENKKIVVRMTKDFGRSGELEGVFITEQKYIDILVGETIEVYFGEVLGKHSEVMCIFTHEDFEIISEDLSVVKVIEENNLTSGYNPFDYEAYGIEIQEGEVMDGDVLDIVKRFDEVNQGS